jgi:hypothetical protein
VILITIRRAYCDQVRVEHPNLDAQFLQPPPVQKRRVGASGMTRQHRMLLDDLGVVLDMPLEPQGGRWNKAPALRLVNKSSLFL